jgi:predicted DNA-binding transcriptional regulator AlpA
MKLAGVWQRCSRGIKYAVVIYSDQFMERYSKLMPALPVANGLSTDHPVPGLPFVDDTHIPLEDPEATEAIGRGAGKGMWGRWDKEQPDAGWRAFTTDPIRHDLAWCVRHHPQHGRSVLLVRDEDAAGLHSNWHSGPLLWRAGGYWWDGATWYRPLQVWDAAGEEYARRPARSAITMSAADVLDDSADPSAAGAVKIANLDLGAPPPERWGDHLALWAARRAKGQEALPLSQCVVNLSAPELAGDQLLGATDMAALAGIAASTLRAYLSRNEAEVPQPQATVSGRSAWSRPVVEDWIEQRSRSAESVAATMATSDTDGLPIGATEVRKHYTHAFTIRLWGNPERRKRWVLRHRTEEAVRQVADELAWEVAASLEEILPADDLATTIQLAVLDEFSTGLERNKKLDGTAHEPFFFGLATPVAKMLDWLIRHHPTTAQYTVNTIIGEAERRLVVDREVTAQSLRTALALDGKLGEGAYHDFFERVLPPTD